MRSLQVNPMVDLQSLRTKTISNKDHFVQGRPFRTKAYRSHFEQGFWSLYELNDSSACVCKNSGTTSYKKSLFEVTPMPLYEMVSLVRSGLCSKWFLYEVT